MAREVEIVFAATVSSHDDFASIRSLLLSRGRPTIQAAGFRVSIGSNDLFWEIPGASCSEGGHSKGEILQRLRTFAQLLIPWTNRTVAEILNISNGELDRLGINHGPFLTPNAWKAAPRGTQGGPGKSIYDMPIEIPINPDCYLPDGKKRWDPI